jgi:glycine dehydrogenase subunit 2
VLCHPAAPDDVSQGFLACLFALQEMLRETCGMAAVSLAPQTESQSVFACVAMLRAYHDARGDSARTEILVLARASAAVTSAAAMCGYVLREIPNEAIALKAHVGPQTAALLLTQERAAETRAMVREAGALLVASACINNLADTIPAGDVDALAVSIPQAGGTTHGWAVAVSKPLQHFLPLPVVTQGNDVFRMLAEKDLPLSIGRLGIAWDNAALLNAYLFMAAEK